MSFRGGYLIKKEYNKKTKREKMGVFERIFFTNKEEEEII